MIQIERDKITSIAEAEEKDATVRPVFETFKTTLEFKLSPKAFNFKH